MLNIPKVTISRAVAYWREQSKKNIKEHISDKLPLEYNKCISGLEEIIKESWNVATQADKIGNNKDKLQSLALIKDTYNTKMDLLTNASLLQDSIKFVEQNKEAGTEMTSVLKSNNKKEVLENRIQGSTEDYSDQSEQFNQVF